MPVISSGFQALVDQFKTDHLTGKLSNADIQKFEKKLGRKIRYGLSGSHGPPWEPMQRSANPHRKGICAESPIGITDHGLVCIPTDDRGNESELV